MEDRFWLLGSIITNIVFSSLSSFLKSQVFTSFCLLLFKIWKHHCTLLKSSLSHGLPAAVWVLCSFVVDAACFSHCIRSKKELKHLLSYCHALLSSVPHILLINSPRDRLILRLFWDLLIQGNARIAGGPTLRTTEKTKR